MRSKGITIVELLISLVIFAIVMAAFYNLMISLLHTNATTQNRMNVNTKAQQYIEKVITDWKDIEHFNKACVTQISWPTNVTITAEPLQVSFSPYAVTSLGKAQVLQLCDTSAVILQPSLQRITVQVQEGNKTSITLYDMGQP